MRVMVNTGDTAQKRHLRNKGFSLVEMAVVVVLMGIFLTLGLAAFNAQTGNAALSTTKKKQEIIRDALITYLRDFRRLPCPEAVTAFPTDGPVGKESRQEGSPLKNCLSYWGTLPYADLGLSRDVAIDGYENFFTYFVSSARTPAEPDWTLTSAAGFPGFGVGNPGRFAITENGVDTTLSRNLAAVVIVSHGSNGLGAFTLKGRRNAPPTDGDEQKNAPDPGLSDKLPPQWLPPSSFEQLNPPPRIITLIVHDRTETFDDVVMALRPNDLLMPLIKDEALKSAEALIQEQLATVRDAAIAQMLSNACQPVSLSAFTTSLLPTGLPIDPWGAPINYSNPNTETKLTATTPANLETIAFSIWSFGPDRASGGGDDRILTTGLNVTYGQIRTRIPTSPTTACP
ncbi:MAG: prepilin-type N-terminal cleavage/methylation domain-containing protein [Propionivibrio sp.]